MLSGVRIANLMSDLLLCHNYLYESTSEECMTYQFNLSFHIQVLHLDTVCLRTFEEYVEEDLHDLL